MNSQIDENTEEAMWVATQRTSRPSLGLAPSMNYQKATKKLPEPGKVCVGVWEEQGRHGSFFM